jgi:hypothetical protein
MVIHTPRTGLPFVLRPQNHPGPASTSSFHFPSRLILIPGLCWNRADKIDNLPDKVGNPTSGTLIAGNSIRYRTIHMDYSTTLIVVSNDC